MFRAPYLSGTLSGIPMVIFFLYKTLTYMKGYFIIMAYNTMNRIITDKICDNNGSSSHAIKTHLTLQLFRIIRTGWNLALNILCTLLKALILGVIGVL